MLAAVEYSDPPGPGSFSKLSLSVMVQDQPTSFLPLMIKGHMSEIQKEVVSLHVAHVEHEGKCSVRMY